MAFSGPARGIGVAADTVAPGLCTIDSIVQTPGSEETFDVMVTLPTLDTGGQPIKKIKRVVCVCGDIVDGADPSLGLELPDILALPDVTVTERPLTLADVGTQIKLQPPFVDDKGDNFIVVATED